MANLPSTGSATNTVDDWLVSPQLLGKAANRQLLCPQLQLGISETFEIWVSETDRAPESMKVWHVYNNIADTWTVTS